MIFFNLFVCITYSFINCYKLLLLTIMPYHCGFCGEDGHNRRTCPQRASLVTSEPTPTIEEGDTIEDSELHEMIAGPGAAAFIVIQEPVVTIDRCPICMEDFGSQPTTQLMCNHSYCTNCIMLNLEHGNLVCPMCRNTIMGPSKKVVELQDKVNRQYNELCDQDEKIIFYEAKFESFEQDVKRKKEQINTLRHDIDDIAHTIGLTGQHELNTFITGITLEYEKYQDTLHEYDASIKSPPLYSLIQSLFESKPTIDSASAMMSKSTCVDGNGVILSHDCWVKVISGLYRNHMGRVIWKSSTSHTPGYFVVRVYRGLGKPKLSHGVYDCSYTEDIKLCMTSGMVTMSGGASNCIISRFMIERIPDNVVRFTIEGNGVALPKSIRTQLRQGKISIILNRLHTKKTGGITLTDKGLHNNPTLVKDCVSNSIPSSLVPSIAAVQEASSYEITEDGDLEFV